MSVNIAPEKASRQKARWKVFQNDEGAWERIKAAGNPFCCLCGDPLYFNPSASDRPGAVFGIMGDGVPDRCALCFELTAELPSSSSPVPV